MNGSRPLAIMAWVLPISVLLCVIGVGERNTWSDEPLSEGDKFSKLGRACAGLAVGGDMYRLVLKEDRYILHDTMKNKTVHIPDSATWLNPRGVEEAERDAYVSSLNWNKSVTDFHVAEGITGLHLASYEIQKDGSAQMAAGRDIFLVLDRDGTLYPGLVDLGITQERGRDEGQWFAVSHRFRSGDIDHDGFKDLAVFKEEILPQRAADNVSSHTMPAVQQHPIRWHVYRPSSHSWVHQAVYDGQWESLGCSVVELPERDRTMSPVDFVKRKYHMK